MIIFDLQCGCGCQFEGWFESRGDFDRQQEEGLLTCPSCGSNRVSKILSPVSSIQTARSREQPGKTSEDQGVEHEVLRYLHAVQEIVEQQFEDVGSKLAEESLKMHYGVTEQRNIRGVATKAQEQMLKEEGIELLKIPLVKKGPDPSLQ